MSLLLKAAVKEKFFGFASSAAARFSRVRFPLRECSTRFRLYRPSQENMECRALRATKRGLS